MTTSSTVLIGDCVEHMRAMPDASVDSVVTDPPYGISFMGKRWDIDVPSVEVWQECLRVLKPGGYLLAFAGTRTQHRMATHIEAAGFEIRDVIAWLYGSGFPKSLDVAKAIDKRAGIWRGRAGAEIGQSRAMAGPKYERTGKGDPVTTDAVAWDGWGTALKPAMEPITVARKPLDGTVTDNVLAHGTGALNIDACRVPSSDTIPRITGKAILGGTTDGWDSPWKSDPVAVAARQQRADAAIEKANRLGRWPANVVHDGGEEVLDEFPSDGRPARFFYVAKPSAAERGTDNVHPTVKPIALMRYLVRLVTRRGGLVLDPFCGSGTTGLAAVAEDCAFVGLERDASYAAIAKRRLGGAERTSGLTMRSAAPLPSPV